MNNEEKILALLEQMNSRQDKTESLLTAMQSDITELKQGQATMQKKQENHTQAIMNLENNVTCELKMLNELLKA